MVKLSPLKFDIHLVASACLNDLLAILGSISGTRHILILEKALSSRLNLLTPFNVLKEKGNIVSVLWLEDDINKNINLTNLNLNSFVLLCSNHITNAELVDRKVKELILINPNFNISGIIVDEVSKSFEFKLEQLGTKGEIQLYSWDLKPTILDDNILSLELFDDGDDNNNGRSSNTIKDIYLRNIDEPVFKLSKSLLNLIKLFPNLIKFNNILLKGNKAIEFYDIFKNLRNEYLSALNPVQRKQEEMFERANYLSSSNNIANGRNNHRFNSSAVQNDGDQFIDLIVLERSLDFVTPLLNQLTYLGLIDEFYGFKSNAVHLGKDFIVSDDHAKQKNDQQPTAATSTSTNNNNNAKPVDKINFSFKEDEILAKIKDLNFAAVGPILNTYAKALQSEFDARHNVKKISEVKEFVGKLSVLQRNQHFLKNHTVLAENILLKAKGNPSNDETSPDLQVFQEDEDEEQNENLFSQCLELQQSLLDNYYDYKKATELIINLIHHGLSVTETLRLCCLLSKVKNGVNEKNYYLLKNEIITNFGIKHLITLQNLKKMKLFYIKESSGASMYLLPTGASANHDKDNNEDSNEASVSYLKNFTGVKNYLNLTPNFDELEAAESNAVNNTSNTIRTDDPENPPDASFAFPNYVPITTRLVQAAYDRSFIDSSLSSYLLKSSSRYLSKFASWKGTDDLWRFLAGEVKETNYFENLSSNFKLITGLNSNSINNNNNNTTSTKNPGLSSSHLNSSNSSSSSLHNLNSWKNFSQLNQNQSQKQQELLCFIVMIGGITYGEIATIRYIEKKLQQKGINKKFVILTDGIVNGSKIIEAAIPQDITDC